MPFIPFHTNLQSFDKKTQFLLEEYHVMTIQYYYFNMNIQNTINMLGDLKTDAFVH